MEIYAIDYGFIFKNTTFIPYLLFWRCHYHEANNHLSTLIYWELVFSNISDYDFVNSFSRLTYYDTSFILLNCVNLVLQKKIIIWYRDRWRPYHEEEIHVFESLSLLSWNNFDEENDLDQIFYFFQLITDVKSEYFQYYR